MKKLIINSENSHLNDDNTVDVPAKSFSKKKMQYYDMLEIQIPQE